MKFDRFLIAPLETGFTEGLRRDLRPWLIPDQAFATLNNAYVFRGRVRKRFGSRYMVPSPLATRFRIQVATTDAFGDATGQVPSTALAAEPGFLYQVGQAFSISNAFYTVVTAGVAQPMLQTVPTFTATFDTTNGTFVFNGAPPLSPVFYYPAFPVMGLTLYELGPINNQPSFGFDTRYAYTFTGGSWVRSFNTPPGGPPADFDNAPLWHGNDLNFFWTNNWQGITDDHVAMFVTNFQAAIGTPSVKDDPIWTFDSQRTPNWTALSYSPSVLLNPTNAQPITVTRTTGGGNDVIASFVQTCRIVVSFKNRLLLLNTIENTNGASAVPITAATYIAAGSTNQQFVNRCRYSHNGSPFAQNAWLEPNVTYTTGAGTTVADGGGFIDATTQEAIISAEFIKDRLIVYFERSTYELVYTGNEIQPFLWQKINTELGAESQQSIVPFDKFVLGIANTGVHACNGSNVERIDIKIPDEIFNITNKDLGVQRVAGVRDYTVEMVYWSFPADTQNGLEKFPTRVLVYNYRNNSWAFNDDCITAFGYFEQQTGITWADAVWQWQVADTAWNSGTDQPQFRQVIAGNQEGYVFIIDAGQNRNAGVMQITNMINIIGGGITITAIDHTLQEGEFVLIENAVFAGPDVINGKIFEVIKVNTANQFVINNLQGNAAIGGAYQGGGTIARVSNVEILSKEWNPYIGEDRNFFLHKIEFGVQRTDFGVMTIDYFPSSSGQSMLLLGGPLGTGAIMGTGVLETFPQINTLEEFQSRLWHPVYFGTDGEVIQIRIYMTDIQMFDPQIALEGFELEGIILFTQRTGYRLQ